MNVFIIQSKQINTNFMRIKPPKNIKQTKNNIFFSSTISRQYGYINKLDLNIKNLTRLKIGNVFCDKNIFIITLNTAGQL